MAGKESHRGSTASTVSANVTAVRNDQNLNFTQVSDRLAAVGWSISAVGVRRIESGERRVDVDDLMALSLALGVSPITLLMPKVDGGDDLVSTTGVDADVEARRLWRWLIAELPLTVDTGEAVLGFLLRSNPSWLIGEGNEIDLAESRATPNAVKIVRRYGRRHIREETDFRRGSADGDDQ